MNIGLDIDGPIYPWHYSMYKYFTEFKGYEGHQREFWDYFKGLSEEEQDYYVSIPHLYLDTTPREGCVEYINKLSELGTLYYITSRIEPLHGVTRKFFDEYDLPFKENLIFAKNKSPYIRLHSIDFFVDDLPRHVDSLMNLTKVFLYRVEHNYRVWEKYDTVGSIKEFYERIVEHGK